nr:hypothetical protein [Tanacetum cinerariifolium]
PATTAAVAGKATAVAVAPAVVAGVSGGCGGTAVEVVARGVGSVEVVEMKVLVASAGGDAGGVAATAAWQRGCGNGGDVGGSGSWLEVAAVRGEKWWLDQIDRDTRSNLGFAGKISPKKFSGGGRPAAGAVAGWRSATVIGRERR